MAAVAAAVVGVNRCTRKSLFPFSRGLLSDGSRSAGARFSLHYLWDSTQNLLRTIKTLPVSRTRCFLSNTYIYIVMWDLRCLAMAL